MLQQQYESEISYERAYRYVGGRYRWKVQCSLVERVHQAGIIVRSRFVANGISRKYLFFGTFFVLLNPLFFSTRATFNPAVKLILFPLRIIFDSARISGDNAASYI